MSLPANRLRTSLRRPWVARIGVIIALFGVWEVAARWWVDPMFFSPPSQVFASLGALFDTRGVPAALRLTFWELGVAFVLSVGIGLLIGLPLGLAPFARRSFMPIVLLLYGTPQVTILPLFVLYFGIGPASKIAFGVSHGFFPLIIAVVAGVENIKQFFLMCARSMGASRLQVLRHFVFPHMIPSFFSGMRIGFTVALLSIIGSETIASLAGLGHRIVHLAEAMEMTRMFAYIVFVVAIAATLNALVSALEARVRSAR